MRKTRLLLLGCLTALVLVACSKEKSIDTTDPAGNGGNGGGGGGGATGTEAGNWKFISLHSITDVTVDITDGVDKAKTVTLSDYTTKDNVGTIKFDGSKATTTGLGYAVDIVAKGYFYDNDVLVDSLEAPISFTAPPTSGQAPYKKIGTDSLYFASGGFISLDTGGGSTPTTSAGYKLRWEGDKMYMTLNLNQSKSETQAGVTQKTVTKATVVMTLQKL